MKKSLQFVGISFILTFILFTYTPNVVEASELIISVDGHEYDMNHEITSYVNNGRTMVPLRTISEELGHHIHWDNSSKTITIDDNIIMKIGSKNLHFKDGNSILKMDIHPEIKNGKTYVPIRFLSEALDHKVEYINYGQISRINIIKDYKTRFKTPKIDNDNNYFGKILNIDLNPNKVYFKLLEFISDEYSDNNYHVEELNDLRIFHLTNNTEYHIIYIDDSGVAYRRATKKEFNNNLSAPWPLSIGYGTPYYTLETKGDEIITIKAFYVP